MQCIRSSLLKRQPEYHKRLQKFEHKNKTLPQGMKMSQKTLSLLEHQNENQMRFERWKKP